MRSFFARKAFFLLAVLGGLILFIFTLFVTLPSPEQILIGQRSDKATTDAIVKELGLDQPKWKQLIWYLNDLSPLALYDKESPKVEKTGGIQLLSTSNTVCKIKWPYLRNSFQTKQPQRHD